LGAARCKGGSCARKGSTLKNTLLLFDIDGTLIRTTAGRRALRAAFRHLYDIEAADDGVPTAGRTDVHILKDLMEAHGIPKTQGGRIRRTYLMFLYQEMRQDPGVRLPGVPELLRALQGVPHTYLALGTGNMEEGARVKLAPHGLNDFFLTGGFADDGEDRRGVIRRGVQKCREAFNVDFQRVVVIGDTPLDVDCGKANGCYTLAVATGPYSVEQLAAHGPDAVAPDLTDTERWVEWLTRHD
jgi:phosphoglycolate phosphatase